MAREGREMTTDVPVLAIDGPTASGKGVVASKVADTLGWRYLDSGAIYRVLALAALADGTDLANEEALAKTGATLDVAFPTGRILLCGNDVSDAVRQEAVGNAASRIAVLPAVRSALLSRQHAFRHSPGLVADGRDMGSVVFPDAICKIFLTASARVRAERRYKQLIEKGFAANIDSLHQDLLERDARDASRAVAPLKPCEDALVLDTSALSIDDAVRFVLDQVERRGFLPVA